MGAKRGRSSKLPGGDRRVLKGFRVSASSWRWAAAALMPPMHAVLVFNPLSGRGKAAALAADVMDALQRRGCAIDRVEIGPAAVRRDLRQALRDAKAQGDASAADAATRGNGDGGGSGSDGGSVMIIVGGDGTVHWTAPAAADIGVPLYHYPAGTENLFAREFGMRADTPTLNAALDRIAAGDQPRRIDVARANGRPFMIMASVGYDANVVHRLARQRKGRITKASYIPHGLGELARPRIRPLTVTVDGRVAVRERSGWLVIANSRQYAVRADPARRAKPDDGSLDVVFFPAASSLKALAWMGRARLGELPFGHMGAAELVYETGRDITVSCSRGEMAYQLDGEAPLVQAGPDPAIDPDGPTAPATTPLGVSLDPNALPVAEP
jgi:diacylglycerol kinase family enzyme